MHEKVKTEWCDLLFSVRRSARYHTHRRKFFDKLGVWSDFLIIVSGGTVVSLASAGDGKHNCWTIFFGAMVGIIGSFDLVIGFSNKARDFHDLAREFGALEREMVSVGENPSKADLTKATICRLEIEDREPPILQVLNCYCHNELIRADGKPIDEKVEITFWQSFFKQWCDLHPATLEKVVDKKQHNPCP